MSLPNFAESTYLSASQDTINLSAFQFCSLPSNMNRVPNSCNCPSPCPLFNPYYPYLIYSSPSLPPPSPYTDSHSSPLSVPSPCLPPPSPLILDNSPPRSILSSPFLSPTLPPSSNLPLSPRETRESYIRDIQNREEGGVHLPEPITHASPRSRRIILFLSRCFPYLRFLLPGERG